MEKQVSVGSWINVWVNEFSKKPKNKKISKKATKHIYIVLNKC